MSGGSIKQIYLSSIYRYNFDQMRGTFGTLFDTIIPLLVESTPSLQELKTYLRRCFQELRLQLSVAESFDDVMDIVEQKCTITNIACLEVIVDYYKIEEAKPHITAYKSKVAAFCQDVKLSLCQDEDFMIGRSTLLKYETIEFVVDWRTNEYELSYIRDLLIMAFKDMAKRVLVEAIGEG